MGTSLFVRLNGTSDIRWENEPIGHAYANIMQALPISSFTIILRSLIASISQIITDLTFSYSGVADYAPYVAKAVANGERIAVVFRDRSTVERMLANGETFLGLPLVDGDNTDIETPLIPRARLWRYMPRARLAKINLVLL